jgi:hypothetical protein
MNARRTFLSVTPLEDRDVPASFGVPWADSTHLTISFAPDGTSAAGMASNLEAAFDGMGRAAWRAAILRAADTWARAANLEIGVVADGGQPFGDSGATQGDARFGDIRIGGLAMAGDALGAAIPPDPLLSGTMAGDVFFNTTAAFTPNLLYRVALHELGHALGLAPSPNPNSVMFNTVGTRTTLSVGDITALRRLYGARAGDPNEGSNGNNSIKRATRLDFPSSYDGETPLVGFGRVGSGDVDVFMFRSPDDYAGPTTVRVQTAGLSLLTPRVIVYDQRGREVGRATGTGAEGDTLTVTLPGIEAGRKYYARVAAAPGADGRAGRFGIAVTFDGLVQPSGITLDEVLRGPYDALDESDLAEVFENPQAALYVEDGGTDDTDDEATDLKPLAGRFAATASMTTAADVDFYRLRAPKAARRIPLVLTVTARPIGPNGVLPSVEVFDRDMNPMAAEVLRNGNGEYAVQVAGAESDRRFFLRWSGPGAGNFAFEAAFRKTPIPFEDFAIGSTTVAAPAEYKLYAARTQLFGFSLQPNGPAGSAVRMTIRNEAGQTVFDLTAAAGETVTARSLFLAPGEYDIVLTPVGADGPLDFRLRGAVETDPLGPQPGNSALAPKYADPTTPGQYVYPGNVVSLATYLFIRR